jgi:outer membrane protein, multidrug efflux system
MKRLAILLMLSGCMVGPNYQTPEIAMPEAFAENKSEEEASDSDLSGWWKQFNDPLLDSLIAAAIESNYDYRIALEKIEQARAQYRIENSYLWPEFDFNAISTRNRNSQNLLTSSGGTSTVPKFSNFFLLGFDAIWEFDFFGKYRRARESAFYSWEAFIDNAQNVLITVVSEVALYYTNIRGVQQQIELTLKKIDALERELTLQKDLQQAGLMSQIQVDAQISLFETTRATLPTLYASLKQTIYGLGVLLGSEPEKLASQFETSGSIPFAAGKVPVGLPSDLLKRRPDVRQAERQLAAATAEIGYYVADLFPRISLTGSTFGGGTFTSGVGGGSAAGWESTKLGSLLKTASQFFSIGPALNWDLIDFGRTKGNIAVQESIAKQAELSYQETVISALKDVESALIAYFQEQRRIAFVGHEVAANLEALALTEDLLDAGLASEIQVLDAKITLIDSESTLVSSEQSLTGDLISLYKALGGDWACSTTP